MNTATRLRNTPLIRRFYPYQQPHCNHSSLPSHNGTGIWQHFNATTFSNNTDDSHHPRPSSMHGSDEHQPIWLFPNGTALINGTILGHPNGTAVLNCSSSNLTAAISSTSTTTNLTPGIRPNNDGEPNDNPGTNAHARPNTNDGTNTISGTSLTATENQANTASLTSSNTIPASAMIPAIVIPLILAVLLVVALIWCCRYRKHKKSEDSEKGYPGPSDSMNFSSSSRMSRTPQGPAYVAWVDTPRQQQQQMPLPPPPAQIYRHNPRASSCYPSDHNRTRSPAISAYEESIRDSMRSPRRNSAVSALDYNHPPLPAQPDSHGHFMPRNYYDGQNYGRRDSRPPMDSVDAFLSPKPQSQQGQDRWVGNRGNNGAPDGRFF